MAAVYLPRISDTPALPPLAAEDAWMDALQAQWDAEAAAVPGDADTDTSPAAAAAAATALAAAQQAVQQAFDRSVMLLCSRRCTRHAHASCGPHKRCQAKQKQPH